MLIMKRYLFFLAYITLLSSCLKNEIIKSSNYGHANNNNFNNNYKNAARVIPKKNLTQIDNIIEYGNADAELKKDYLRSKDYYNQKNKETLQRVLNSYSRVRSSAYNYEESKKKKRKNYDNFSEQSRFVPIKNINNMIKLQMLDIVALNEQDSATIREIYSKENTQKNSNSEKLELDQNFYFDNDPNYDYGNSEHEDDSRHQISTSDAIEAQIKSSSNKY